MKHDLDPGWVHLEPGHAAKVFESFDAACTAAATAVGYGGLIEFDREAGNAVWRGMSREFAIRRLVDHKAVMVVSMLGGMKE